MAVRERVEGGGWEGRIAVWPLDDGAAWSLLAGCKQHCCWPLWCTMLLGSWISIPLAIIIMLVDSVAFIPVFLFHTLWPEVVLCSITFWWQSCRVYVHTPAPCSAHALAQARPTMWCIHLVIIASVFICLLAWLVGCIGIHYIPKCHNMGDFAYTIKIWDGIVCVYVNLVKNYITCE